jgi:phosphatidylglycerol lysyltransferase
MRRGSTTARARALRLLVPTAGFGIAIWTYLQLPPGAAMTAFAGLADIALWRWGLALALTGLSYVVVGHLESLWHIALRVNSQPYTARRTGRIAIAIGQCVGMASVVAGLVRWHLLRGVAQAGDVARVSLAVSLSFTLCMSVSALLALWWIALAAFPALSWPMVPVVAAALGLALWSQRRWGWPCGAMVPSCRRSAGWPPG